MQFTRVSCLESTSVLWYNSFNYMLEESIMSYADQVFMQNVREILDHGVWDTDREVRPH